MPILDVVYKLGFDQHVIELLKRYPDEVYLNVCCANLIYFLSNLKETSKASYWNSFNAAATCDMVVKARASLTALYENALNGSSGVSITIFGAVREVHMEDFHYRECQDSFLLFVA